MFQQGMKFTVYRIIILKDFWFSNNSINVNNIYLIYYDAITTPVQNIKRMEGYY